MNGVDLATVAELLGHSTTTMTERYSHLSPDHKTRAVKTLDFAYQTESKTESLLRPCRLEQLDDFDVASPGRPKQSIPTLSTLAFNVHIRPSF